MSGVTGTGGGVFLAPVIVLMGWSDLRRAAPVAAAYNLLNSAAAFGGAAATLPQLPPALPLWLIVAAAGAVLGAWLASQRLPERTMRLLLAGLLTVSAVKLLWP